MHVFYSLFIYPSLHLIVHRFVSWSVTGATVLVLASIITRFSSMLTLSVCPSAVVQANSQSLPSNESISIINRSVIESVSLWDRPLVSWLNKKKLIQNSGTSIGNNNVYAVTFACKSSPVRHLCALLLCRALSLEYQSKKARPNHRLRNIMQMLSSTFFWGSLVR